MNQKHRPYIVLFMLSLLFLAGCGKPTGNQPTGNVVVEKEKPVVKIGASLSLTGGSAFMGEGMRNAMELAIHNLGPTKYKYELVFEDDAMNPKMAADASQKLITIDHVDAILSLSSGTGNVVSQFTQPNKVIHFGVASDPTVAEGEYNFIHWTPPEEETRALISELERRNLHNVAFISFNQQGEKAIMNDFSHRVEGTEISVVSTKIFNNGEKDFKTYLLQIEQERPDVIVVLAFSPEIEIIMKQIKELDIDTPVTSIEAVEFSEQPELFEGVWYIQAADPTDTFLADYVSTYGKQPAPGTANAYDEVNMIVAGFERAGKNPLKKPSTAEVVAELHKIKDFPGALGPLTVPESGIVLSHAVVRIVKDGKFVTIKP